MLNAFLIVGIYLCVIAAVGLLLLLAYMMVKWVIEDRQRAKEDQEQSDQELALANQRVDQALANLIGARDRLMEANQNLQAEIDRQLNPNNHDPNLN
jgi:flagellar basal body-associated protein FliL